MDLPGFSLDMGALKQTKAPDPNKTYDLLVLGGGPAAMSAVVYAARKMISVAVITKDFGGQVNETSEVDNYLGFQGIDAKALVEKFIEHVDEFDLPVSKGPAIKRIEQDGGLFKVLTDDGNAYAGTTVLLATGATHRRLGVPGEAELVGRGVAYCATCDAPFYKGKKVAIAGGGNSAFTTAIDLIKVGAEITMVNFAEGWNADGGIIKRVESYAGIAMLDNHQVVRVEGKDKLEAVVVKDRESGDEKTIDAQGLFVEIGLSANSDLARGLIDMNERGEVVVDCNCRTSLPGFFAAGDVTTVPYKQIVNFCPRSKRT